MDSPEMNWKYWIGDHPDVYPLPTLLSMALEKGRTPDTPRSTLGLHPEVFHKIMQSMLEAAVLCSVSLGLPAYHNGQHFVEVLANVRLLVEQVPGGMPTGVKQALFFAAVGHDFGHPGVTFRRDAQHDGRLRPELGVDLSNEEISALVVDEMADQFGFNAWARHLICRLIHATTFGNPAIKPQSPLEKLLVCADVAPNDPFLVWYKKGVDVVYNEQPAKPAPRTFSGWIQNRLGFVQYVRSVLTPEAVVLGWDKMLDGHERELQRAIEMSDPLHTNMLRALLAAESINLYG